MLELDSVLKTCNEREGEKGGRKQKWLQARDTTVLYSSVLALVGQSSGEGLGCG